MILEKLQKLHSSVQRLETVLQEVWGLIDEIGEDDEFVELMNRAKKAKKQGGDEKITKFTELLNEFEQCMEDIPEDGTAAVDFEDAIAELIEWMNNNRK